MELVVCQVVGV